MSDGKNTKAAIGVLMILWPFIAALAHKFGLPLPDATDVLAQVSQLGGTAVLAKAEAV